MNILVIGSGGREHAICSALRKSVRAEKLFCANGNGGIGAVAECVSIMPDDVMGLAEFASSNNIGLTFVGGETSLALGVVDEFERRGLRIVGPCREAARLESSKSFAKDFMGRHGIPTAKYVVAHSPDFALLELESGDFGKVDRGLVVKADGLAGGKGVVVADDRDEAIRAIKEMNDLVGSAAASKIVLEERLYGKEISLLAFATGEKYALMPATRDHKRIGEGDTGPNTGGMGAITDKGLLDGTQLQMIVETILKPTLHGCIREGFPFRGVLFIGLMMTADGPKVLEYNVRFGDPEAQAILVRLDSDLVDICTDMVDGTLAAENVTWAEGSSACVVLAAEGYPVKARTGDVIHGLNDVKGAEIFHAGTSKNADGNFITAGGRVLGVTGKGATLDEALASAYSAAQKISWPGMQYRSDIGKDNSGQSTS